MSETPDAASAAPLPPSVARVQAALAGHGLTPHIRMLEDSAPTAAAAAAQLGCEVGAIANSLVFLADGEPLLVMTSGAHRVDTAALAARIGVQKIARASADQVRAATGQAIGGVAPLGHPAPLRTVVDEDLAAFEVLYAAAGHPHSIFPLSYAELVAVTGGTVLPVAS